MTCGWAILIECNHWIIAVRWNTSYWSIIYQIPLSRFSYSFDFERHRFYMYTRVHRKLNKFEKVCFYKFLQTRMTERLNRFFKHFSNLDESNISDIEYPGSTFIYNACVLIIPGTDFGFVSIRIFNSRYFFFRSIP